MLTHVNRRLFLLKFNINWTAGILIGVQSDCPGGFTPLTTTKQKNFGLRSLSLSKGIINATVVTGMIIKFEVTVSLQ